MNPDKITDVIFFVLSVLLGAWNVLMAALGREMSGPAGYYFAAMLMAFVALSSYRRLTGNRA